MPIKFISKIFAVILCSIVFAPAVYAQDDKPEAIKYAEVYIHSADTKFKKFTKTLGQFLERLKKESAATKGFISVPPNTELGRKTKSLVSDAGLENRVSFLSDAKHPKYHHYDFVYFFLIPPNTEVPLDCMREPCICPTLDVIAHETVIGQNSTLIFKAKVGDDDIEGLSYHWYLTAGKIIEGQGTSVITVDPQDAKEITATVTVGGFCETCSKVSSETTKIQ